MGTLGDRPLVNYCSSPYGGRGKVGILHLSPKAMKAGINLVVKVKSASESSGPSGCAAYPGVCSMKEYFLTPPLDGMLVHCRDTPGIKFAGTHLYTLL